MYDSVLVPTDGSDGAEAALDHAIGVTERNDAQLHTVYATEIGDLSESLDEETFGQTVDRLRTAGEEAVQRVVAQAQEHGLDTNSAVVDGTADEVILQYVEDNDIDIVVMATRGRTGTAREVMGSVTERVVRSAPVPVLTVNVGE
jgi:nucleotide-binding universal stress UspA family protein